MRYAIVSAGLLACTPGGWTLPPPSDEVAPEVRPVDEIGALSVVDGKLVGGDGRPVQLAGVSTQWLNWEQRYATSAPALRWMRDHWGLQVLRVANGVEYSGGYLRDPDRMGLVKQIVDNAIDAGVYVIVDWHTHEIEHKEDAIAFFTDIAEAYGEQPNVLYEVFNEPIHVDWSSELKPYHEALVAAIREVDPDNVIALGTPMWDQRPDLAAADPLVGANLVYTLHFYACTHGADVRVHGQAALDAGAPLMVTEWGATAADGGMFLPRVCEASAREWHRWLDENGISWAAWKLSADFDRAGILAWGAPVQGGWTEGHLKGHGPLVRRLMLEHRARHLVAAE